MDWNTSPTVKRWIVISAAFALALVFIACMAGSPAHAATPQPVKFTAQGDVTTSDVVPERVIGSVGAPKQGPCWGWDQNWPVDMNTIPHKQMYAPGVHVVWCANPAKTKVVSLTTFNCYDAGGYYDYDGCQKSKGGLGYASLGLSVDWHYHFFMGIPGVTDTRTPSLIFSVYANGHIVGTIYYDN